MGMNQESIFSWGISLGKPWNLIHEGDFCILFDGPEENLANSSEVFSAFTVAELGEMFPHHTPSMKDGQGFSCSTLISEDGAAGIEIAWFLLCVGIARLIKRRKI